MPSRPGSALQTEADPKEHEAARQPAGAGSGNSAARLGCSAAGEWDFPRRHPRKSPQLCPIATGDCGASQLLPASQQRGSASSCGRQLHEPPPAAPSPGNARGRRIRARSCDQIPHPSGSAPASSHSTAARPPISNQAWGVTAEAGSAARQRARGALHAPGPDADSLRNTHLLALPVARCGRPRASPLAAPSNSARGSARRAARPGGWRGGGGLEAARGARRHVAPDAPSRGSGRCPRAARAAGRDPGGAPRRSQARAGPGTPAARGAPPRHPLRRFSLCSAENYGREVGAPARGKKPRVPSGGQSAEHPSRPLAPTPSPPLTAESPPPRPVPALRPLGAVSSSPFYRLPRRTGAGPGSAVSATRSPLRRSSLGPERGRATSAAPAARSPPAPTCSAPLCAAGRPLLRAARPYPWARPLSRPSPFAPPPEARGTPPGTGPPRRAGRGGARRVLRAGGAPAVSGRPAPEAARRPRVRRRLRAAFSNVPVVRARATRSNQSARRPSPSFEASLSFCLSAKVRSRRGHFVRARIEVARLRCGVSGRCCSQRSHLPPHHAAAGGDGSLGARSRCFCVNKQNVPCRQPSARLRNYNWK